MNKAASTSIRRLYSQHVMRAHLGRYAPLTLQQFVAKLFVVASHV